MKNEYKIIIGAIVVILLLLVGAYALSGSNPQPSATPTVLPVTATPTPVPAGGGNVTPSVTPSMTPSMVPSITPVPSVTPTPEPESGVKLTEFGYWITYPPLGPQNWSTNPPRQPKSSNVVYFEPTSGVRPINIRVGATGFYNDTVVYRAGGNLNETINVKIHPTMSDNIAQGYRKLDIPEYVFFLNARDYGNLTGPDENGDYTLVFGPGVTEQGLALSIRNSVVDSAEVMPYEPSEGWVRLTITDVDGGYNIGSQNQYLLSLKYVSEVRFGTWEEERSDGYIYAKIYTDNLNAAVTTGDFGIDYGDYVDHIVENGSFVDVFIPIAREYDTGDMTVNFNWEDDNGDFDTGEIIAAPFTFADGYNEGLAKVSIPKQYVLDGTSNEVTVHIVNSGDYVVIYPGQFDIFINYKK